MTTPHEKAHHASCIQLVPIFNHLEGDLMDVIADKAKTRTYQKGEIIYQPHDHDATLYIVHSGKIKVFFLLESGREQLIRILQPGDFTGEWIIFNPKEVHRSFAEAMTTTQVCLLEQKDMQALMLEYPQIAITLLREISKRLAGSEEQTRQVSMDQVGSRIAAYLADTMTQESGEVVELSMSRKDLAAYLGTTPETVSRKFKELVAKGIIEEVSRNKIRIFDENRLIWYESEA